MLLMLMEIATEPATHSGAVDFSLLFIKMIAALIVACVAAVLVLKYAVPKLSFTKRLMAGKGIKILSRMSIGNKQYLYLVKVAGKCILIGATDGGINKIDDIDENKLGTEPEGTCPVDE